MHSGANSVCECSLSVAEPLTLTMAGAAAKQIISKENLQTFYFKFPKLSSYCPTNFITITFIIIFLKLEQAYQEVR